MALFDFQKPEVTTVIRWLLRVILVVFLAWLVKRRPDQDDEEEQQEDEGEEEDVSSRRDWRANAGRGGARSSRAANPRTMSRMGVQPRYQQQYPPGPSAGAGGLRQRRGPGEDVDFDAVISKISKPKEMWEVRKSGEKPQICKRQDREQADGGGAAAARGGGGAAAAGGSAAARPGAAAGIREAKGKENTLRGHERPVTFIMWNRDCNLLFTCGKDKIVCVWSFPDGECLGNYSGHSGAVWACSVTADSRWLVTSGADRLVIVWEARTSRELARVELPGVVRCVEWAGVGAEAAAEPPATERFVTCHNRFGSHPAALGVWRFDGEAIEQLLAITTLPTPASQVRWGLSDELVASSHDNGELCFWRADTGVEVKRLKAHEEGISKFDFSVDRQLVATASHDKTVMVWDLAKDDGKLLYKGETDRPLNAVAMGPLTYSAATGVPSGRPSGCRVIAAGGQDARDVALSGSAVEQFGTVLFCLGSDEQLPGKLQADGVTKGHFGPVHTLAFAMDGSAIASGSEDGCVRIHMFDSAPAAAGDSQKEVPQA